MQQELRARGPLIWLDMDQEALDDVVAKVAAAVQLAVRIS